MTEDNHISQSANGSGNQLIGQMNGGTVIANVEYLDQGTDAETIRAVMQDVLVNKAQPDYEIWRAELNNYFSNSLKSKQASLTAFKQVIDIQNQNVNFIKRLELSDRLDNWYSVWKNEHKIFMLTGEEGDGKTWGVAYWLEQKIQKTPGFPPVLFLPSSSKINREAVEIVSELIAQILDRTIEVSKNNVKYWLDQQVEQQPTLVLILDGINEHHKFPLWLDLINTFSDSPWKDQVAVIVTCRQEYWQSNSPRYLQPEEYNLASYNEVELTEALRANDLNYSEISKNLIPLISKPRYFDLMVRYREKISASGDITVQRLIYEDWKDRYDRKTSISLSDDDFQGLIRELAVKHVKIINENIDRLNTRKISKLEIDSIIPSMNDKLEVFNEIKSSGIIKGGRGLFKVDKNFLVHGFGLLLVEELVQTIELGDVELEEIASQWLEPHAAMDIKGLICQAASLISLNDTAIPLRVKITLLDVWVSSQNPSEDTEKDFIAYLPLAPEAYIELAEIVWSAEINNSWAQELLMSAFKHWLNNNRFIAVLNPAIERWLGFVHRFGFVTYRRNRQEDDLRDEINKRVGQELQLGAFSFHGYQLTAIEDDGLLRLGRVALGLISLLPKPDYIRAISIGCLSEALIDYPSKYDLFQWVILTSKEPIWNEIETEVIKLTSLMNFSANQSAYRLLSFIGNSQSKIIQETFPDNLFPREPWQKELFSDPCRFRWKKEDCQICLERTDLNLHTIAQGIQPFCLNPNFVIPEDLRGKLLTLISDIDETKIWSSVYSNSDTNHYEQYEIPLCAYVHSPIADKIRQIIQGIVSRSGDSLRQLSFRLLDHYLLFGKTERKYILQAWLDFSSKFEEIGEDEELAHSKIFTLVLKDLDAEQQLDYLLWRSELVQDELSIQTSFKSLIINKNKLQKLINGKTPIGLTRIFWFISRSYNNLSKETVKEVVYPLTKHHDSLVRFTTLKILYLSQIEELIIDFIHGSWKWSHRHNYWENHWGSLILAKYGKDETYSALSLRVDPAYLGILISERGMVSHEVKEFALFIDKKWDEIYHSEDALPIDMPFVDVDAIENGNQNTEEKTIGLSQRYSSSSFQDKDPNYQWGGMTYSRSNTRFFEKETEGDKNTKTLSRIANDFLKFQQESDNRLSSDQIPIDVLIQVVNYCPKLVTKWLSIIEPHHNPERAERLTSFCNIFYESLCAALFHLSDSRSVKLYSFLRNKERKITLFDSITRIYFLDSALFKTSRTDLSNKMWINRLEDCRFDLELMEISIAAQQGGKVDWIEEYAIERLQSDIPIYGRIQRMWEGK
jgi:hypothetical protein